MVCSACFVGICTAKIFLYQAGQNPYPDKVEIRISICQYD